MISLPLYQQTVYLQSVKWTLKGEMRTNFLECSCCRIVYVKQLDLNSIYSDNICNWNTVQHTHIRAHTTKRSLNVDWKTRFYEKYLCISDHWLRRTGHWNMAAGNRIQRSRDLSSGGVPDVRNCHVPNHSGWGNHSPPCVLWLLWYNERG